MSKYENKKITIWKIIKEETGNNNCQNGIKFLKISNSVTNNPQEIPNTFTEYFFTVADTVIGYIKKNNTAPIDDVNPSKC